MRFLPPTFVAVAFLACAGVRALAAGAAPPSSPASSPAHSRPPTNAADLTYWVDNMRRHNFSVEEMQSATGLGRKTILDELERRRTGDSPEPKGLVVLPYPGGRHPRIGFLDGAIRPQRETKISVFTPWDEKSYVVADVPEAIWSNLGLTYLAHAHIPTIFDKQGIVLEPQEWNRRADGTLDMSRRLPNGISFGTVVKPGVDAVRMEMWLSNGTAQALSDLRVQNCVMLKGAVGFTEQTNANKVLSKPFVACRSTDGSKWVITAWEPCHRPWANPPVPCLHSDPKFPDCPPGETRRLKGWLSFYQGTNIQQEFVRIQKIW